MASASTFKRRSCYVWNKIGLPWYSMLTVPDTRAMDNRMTRPAQVCKEPDLAEMLSFRTTPVEAHLVRALAAGRRTSVSELLRTLVQEAAREAFNGFSTPSGVPSPEVKERLARGMNAEVTA